MIKVYSLIDGSCLIRHCLLHVPKDPRSLSKGFSIYAGPPHGNSSACEVFIVVRRWKVRQVDGEE